MRSHVEAATGLIPLPFEFFCDHSLDAPKSWELIELHDGSTVVRLPLTQGFYAALDPGDWDRLRSRFPSWYMNSARGRSYARARVPGAPDRRGGRHQITLQRAVLGAKPGERVKLLNRVTLDCRRENLKLQSRSEAAREVMAFLS